MIPKSRSVMTYCGQSVEDMDKNELIAALAEMQRQSVDMQAKLLNERMLRICAIDTSKGSLIGRFFGDEMRLRRKLVELEILAHELNHQLHEERSAYDKAIADLQVIYRAPKDNA